MKGKSGDEEEKDEKEDVKAVREKHTARKSIDGKKKSPGSWGGNEKRGRKKNEEEVKEEKGSSRRGRKRAAAKTDIGMILTDFLWCVKNDIFCVRSSILTPEKNMFLQCFTEKIQNIWKRSSCILQKNLS